MSPLALLVALLLGLLALPFVIYPLLRHTNVIEQQSSRLAPAGASALTDQEASARAALHEVELDYQLGNLGEEEYRSLRERYMRRALLAMKQRYTREQAIDALIEERLRMLREEDARRTLGE